VREISKKPCVKGFSFDFLYCILTEAFQVLICFESGQTIGACVKLRKDIGNSQAMDNRNKV
jgi:hypothetical protein